VRVLVTSTMAASALAIGLQMDAAQSLTPGSPLGSRIGSPDASVQLVQQGGKQMSPGQGPSFGQGRGQGGAGPSLRQDGGGMRGDGGGMRGDGGGMRRDGGGMRQGGSQFRPGERGLRGEYGYRNGGERRAGPRGGERSGGYIERERRRSGPRGGIYFGPSYGYGPADCGWLRRRALATDSPYWWRRYRACRG